MIKKTRFMAVFALLILTVLFVNLHADISVPMNKSFGEFPVSHREWRMLSQTSFSEAVLRVLKPTDYLFRRYADGSDTPVYLYIGYHGGGKNSGGIHSPKHCMPGAGWYEALEEKISVDVGGRRMQLVKTVYQKGDEKELFLYWYQVKGRALSDEYSLKAYEIINSMLYRRRDSAFIRISVPITGDEQRSFEAGVKFIKDFYPVITEYLPH
ncbi:MAG: exosortase C-terminal domain/associated protein EpsI [Nitrospirota bacterium]